MVKKAASGAISLNIERNRIFGRGSPDLFGCVMALAFRD
jgi:hypothetical protein